MEASSHRDFTRDRLRVCLVTFAPWSGSTGLHVRARAVASDLGSLGTQVTVLSVGAPEAACPMWSEVDGGLNVVPVRARTKATLTPVLANRIRHLAHVIDLLIFESAMFAPAVACSRVHMPLIWDINELEALHYARMRPTVQTRVMQTAWRVLEQWAAHLATVAVAVSQEEATWCQALYPLLQDRVAVVGHRPSVSPAAHDRDASVSPAPRIVFIGTMAAKHNRGAAHWLLHEFPIHLHREVDVLLVGPGSEKVAVGRRGLVGFRGLGTVPDLGAVVAPTDIAVAPLRAGAGVKTKVLDYLALGCRVVATPVALEGLPDPPGVVCATLEAMPSAITELLNKADPPSARAERAELQRHWLAQHASPDSTRADWAAVLDQLRNRLPGWPSH